MDILQQLQDDEYAFPYHYVSQFRNGFTQSFYDVWGINYVSTIEFVLQKLQKEKFDNLIDIGCGDGRLTLEIQKSFQNSLVMGVDYSLRAITLAKSMNPAGNYRQMNILEEEIDKKFDCAILMEVFEHINPDIADAFVKATANLLNPGGTLFVTVPHANKPVEYKHYRHFTSKLLIECFSPYFEAKEVVPFEKGKRRKKLVDFLLGNRLFILNSGKLRKLIYDYYKEHLFHSTEEKCNRILVKFIRK